MHPSEPNKKPSKAAFVMTADARSAIALDNVMHAMKTISRMQPADCLALIAKINAMIAKSKEEMSKEIILAPGSESSEIHHPLQILESVRDFAKHILSAHAEKN